MGQQFLKSQVEIGLVGSFCIGILGEWNSSLSHDVVRLGFPMGIYDLAVVFTIFMEINALIFLFNRKLQKYFFIWGTAFHLLLAFVVQGIPHFLFMPLTYILFVDVDVAESLIKKSKNFGIGIVRFAFRYF